METQERATFDELIAKNRRWTWILLLASFALLAIVATTITVYIGGGWVAVAIGIGTALLLTLLSYAQSDKVALRATRARPATREEFLQLHNLVEEMAIASGIPKPAVYVVHDPAPNAFATGKDPDHAAVAVTTGLLEKLDRDELQGVIAHELAHIRNYDIRVMTVAVATAGSIAMIADIFWRLIYFGAAVGGRRSRDNDRGGNPLTFIALIVVAVLAPIAAALLKAAISRRREGLADASAVAFTRNPTGLRRALEKLDADSTVIQRVSHATSHLWIEQPDERTPNERGAKLNEMFSTHPPLAERINLLRSMEGIAPYRGPDAAVVAELEQRAQQRRLDPATVAGPTPAAGATASAADSFDFGALFGQGSAARPGWYDDPSGAPRTLRYWNGNQWTEHTARARQ